MFILNKEGLMAYKNALLISFTPKNKSTYGFGSIEGVLGNIYSCIMGRKFSGTPQEKYEIAMDARNDLRKIYSNL